MQLYPAGHARASAQPLALAQQSADWPQRPISMMILVAGGLFGHHGPRHRRAAGRAAGPDGRGRDRPGANGAVAAQALARSAADGYTIMTGSIGVFAINKVTCPMTLRDFRADLAGTMLNVLVLNPQQVPATTFASPWPGCGPMADAPPTPPRVSVLSEHLTMELLVLRPGTKRRYIPYQGAAATTALLAGDVQLTFQNLGTVAQHIAAGRLRAVMVTSEARKPTIADVPTAEAQVGLDDFVVTSWQAVMAPAGVPAPILARLEPPASKACATPEAVQRLNQLGVDVGASSAAGFRRFQEAELTRWRGGGARKHQGGIISNPPKSA